jgi:hypothetical protein
MPHQSMKVLLPSTTRRDTVTFFSILCVILVFISIFDVTEIISTYLEGLGFQGLDELLVMSTVTAFGGAVFAIRRLRDLRKAIEQTRILEGLLPICASCKKIRDDKGYWSQLEHYISEHAGITFSHGLCPDCAAKAFAAAEKELHEDDNR